MEPVTGSMLTEGLHWQCDRLMLGPHIVATVTPLDNGTARVCLNPCISGIMRLQFMPSEALGQNHAERWAAKWADRLREIYKVG